MKKGIIGEAGRKTHRPNDRQRENKQKEKSGGGGEKVKNMLESIQTSINMTCPATNDMDETEHNRNMFW
jgi:hypothetical protein